MRVEVNRDKCEGHGICEQVAPKVYQLDEDGELVVHEDVPAELETQAQSGARSCPVAALHVKS